jgi:hypothetical protein
VAQELVDQLWDEYVSPEFKQLVENELVSARQGCRELLGESVAMLQCKWDGCNNEVVSHKGRAGYCVRIQENGKTHRQMFIEKMRETDPDYGKKGRYSKGRPLALRSQVNGFWLREVKDKIIEAMSEVEQAEADLLQAKENLQKILKEAYESVG